MKFAVAGGAGLTGQCAVRDLLRNKKVEGVIVADYDSSGLISLKKILAEESDPLTFEKIDVKDHVATASVPEGVRCSNQRGPVLFQSRRDGGSSCSRR